MQLKSKVIKWRNVIAIIALIVLFFGDTTCSKATKSTPSTQEQAKDKTASSAKQLAAEQAVDKVLARFYETLDFGVVWKEMYVSDEKLRHLEVEAIIFKFLDHEAKDEVSHEAKERAYVAIGNYWHCLSAMTFTASESELEAAYKEIQKPYESFSQHPKKISTSEALDLFVTSKMIEIGTLLRKRVASNQFNSLDYKDKLGKVDENEPANIDRIREVFTPAGLKPETQIYVVDREIFHYYLIEEQGQFKLLTFLLRRRS
jgi:hypothetical protein